MTNTFFVQPCGTCGRPLKIRVTQLGRNVCCQHCGAEFQARDHESESAAMLDPVSHWIGLADEILAEKNECVPVHEAMPIRKAPK